MKESETPPSPLLGVPQKRQANNHIFAEYLAQIHADPGLPLQSLQGGLLSYSFISFLWKGNGGRKDLEERKVWKGERGNSDGGWRCIY